MKKKKKKKKSKITFEVGDQVSVYITGFFETGEVTNVSGIDITVETNDGDVSTYKSYDLIKLHE